MKVVLILIAVVVCFYIGSLVGNKIMIRQFKIPTRLEADNQGKARMWDLVLSFSIVAAILIGILITNSISDGQISIMGMPITAVLSWCFAVYWLVVGICDFTMVRYVGAGGISRYKEPLPLFVTLSISFDLVVLGLFIVTSQHQLMLLTLFIFAALWLQWIGDAARRKKDRKAEEIRRSEEAKRAR
jgi:hypothetical protein